MSKPTIITATEASRNFADLLSRVAYSGESFIIKKGNREMARIAPVPAHEPEVKAKKSERTIKPQQAVAQSEVKTEQPSREQIDYLRGMLLEQADAE